jgi:hypothetical protein
MGVPMAERTVAAVVMVMAGRMPAGVVLFHGVYLT